MKVSNNIILSSTQIEQKIRRIAYQIYESNSTEKEIIVGGIVGNGSVFAKKLIAILEEISPLKILFCEVKVNKKNPLATVTTSIESSSYKDKSVILVDDVLNSGATLIYGVKHFLEVPLKQFKTAVLVNRNHKKYPVKADYKGISLSTSIKEHICVEFSKEKSIAFLK